MIGLVGASGFIGRTIVDDLCANGRAPRIFSRTAIADLPAQLDHRILSLDDEAGGPSDGSEFAGLGSLILSVSATRPNSPGNNLSAELVRNVQPHVRLLERLRHTAVRTLVYLSSGGAIYGDRPDLSLIAEDSPLQPVDAYGFGKLSIEAAIRTLWVGGGRRYVIIRPANPVGMHQLRHAGQHGLVATALSRIAAGQPLRVLGDGGAVRDYFDASDLAVLVRRALDADPALGNQIVNAGSGMGLSILSVIDRCCQALNMPARLDRVAAEPPAVRNNVLNCSRAQEVFGWHAATGFDETLQRLIRVMSLPVT